MEVPGMVDNNDSDKTNAHLTSAAAFVEGGIQEACDDACSICLEDFSESEPSSVTGCKHEFHLQCILEWCQRSSQCPMCWQAISLKAPDSQELLEAVERERNLRFNPTRNATMFHHPMLGDFELQHLPVGVNDSELEERIIQHLAAAAAMGRARHIARREGQRTRSSALIRPQVLVFSTHPNAPVGGSPSSSPALRGDSEPPPIMTVSTASFPHATADEESFQGTTSVLLAQADPVSTPASGSSDHPINQLESPVNNRGSPSRPSPSKDQPGPSEQSFSESLKSRFNAVSARYKESISKGTRGWKERLFSRNTSMTDIGSEVRREVNAGIATASRMVECLETIDNGRTNDAPVNNNLEDNVIQESENRRPPQTGGSNPLAENITHTQCAAGPGTS